MDSFRDIDDLYKYVDCGNMIEEYKVALEQLKAYETEYRVYEAKNDIIESIIADIEDLTTKTDSLASQVEELNNLLSQDRNKLDDLKSAKTKVDELARTVKDDLEPSEGRESELLKIKQSLDVNSTEINELQDQLHTLSSNHGSVMNDINILTDDRNATQQALSMLAQYKEEMKEYSDRYNKIEKIRYYSSPSTGIQTLFMQLYMNKIINTANSLLALLFEGEFVLQPFIINENEFRIPCLGSGLMHDDISSMSTAQKCMISMILSFSILHQSSTKYNIISIDEMDGGLDTNNRGFFIELLDRIMGMMNCEQCFIISHNNELNTASCDVIVLKNTGSEIYQGNIIWQY
jgi:DNA repair exonuclease SbcCD ATPase subunit